MTDERTRRWADGATLWFVGAWMALTVAMAFVAGANFGLLKPDALPRGEEAFGPMIGEPQGALGLRYLASEVNRTFFAVYGWAQLLLGAAATACFLAAGQRSRIVAGMLVLSFATTLVFQFHLVPGIVEMGRVLDLVPKEPVTPDREAFDALHRLSVRLEVGKLVLLAAAGGVLVFRRPAAD